MMRVSTLILVFILAFVFSLYGCVKLNAAAPNISSASLHKPAATASSITTPTKVDFNTQIRPILETRCTPCHFAGGKMYERLPFDRPETIKTLGTKLFTRIKDEKEQRLIQEFLSQ
ncbi:MAG: hypothetical protein WBP93_22450 [Pyrinomonadaceae bacterium]